jgi:type I restriction enzyme M protein
VLDDSLYRLNALSHRPRETVAALAGGKRGRSWSVVRLGDLCEKIFYPGRFKRNYVDRYDGAIPFLGGSNITEIVRKTEKWLRHDDVRLEQLAVREGWILVTRSGTTGIVSSVPKAWDGAAISEHVIRIVCDPKRIDPNYLLTYLRTETCQLQIQSGTFGSVIDEISPDFLADLRIPIPKDLKLVKELTLKMRDAERARDKAIIGFDESVKELEKLLLN